MIVGPSAHSNAKSIDLVNIAMVNDLHFWGLARSDTTKNPLMPEEDLWPLAGHLWSAHENTDGGFADDGPQFAEEGPQLAMLDRLQNHPAREGAMGADEIEAELSLCQQLVQWNPWSLPTADLAGAMQKVFFKTIPEFKNQDNIFF